MVRGAGALDGVFAPVLRAGAAQPSITTAPGGGASARAGKQDAFCCTTTSPVATSGRRLMSDLPFGLKTSRSGTSSSRRFRCWTYSASVALTRSCFLLLYIKLDNGVTVHQA